MEKKSEEKGLDNSFFMKEKSETSFREERKSQPERDNNDFSSNRGFGSDGSKRRSFNPNFDSENRPKGFNSHREPVYKTRQGENSIVGEGNKNRRPRIRRNEGENGSAPYQNEEQQKSRSPFSNIGDDSSSPFNHDSSYRSNSSYSRDSRRENSSYNRDNQGENSSYSNSYNKEGSSSYNRDSRRENSSYNRGEGTSSYSQNREGSSSYGGRGGSSYGGRGGSSYGNRNGGGSSYNRESGSSYNREGGSSYSRDSRRDNSSYNRRDSYNNNSSYNRENNNENRGSYSRPSYRDGEHSSRPSYGRRDNSTQYGQREGGYSREGGSRERNNSYSQSRPQYRSNGDNRNGGYERSGGYNREGGYGRDNGYSNRDNGGYNRGDRDRRGGRDGRDGAKKRFKSTAPFMPMPMMNEEIRLNRYVAMSGVCSRREADEIIKAGEITINGEVKIELGIRVQPGDVVCHNGVQLSGEKLVYIVMNKPKNAVTTVEDPNAETTVIDILGDKVKERVFPVGRLDKNSMGVIILTNDGVLAKELTHPSYEKKKIYHVFLDKPVKEEDMEQLANGIELEDGMAYADELSYVSEDTREVGIEIHSGRNRIIRRMFEHLGYKVMKLDRVYFAGITKKGLKRGFWRYLTAQEVGKLKNRSTRK